jgi:hypothetical protein
LSAFADSPKLVATTDRLAMVRSVAPATPATGPAAAPATTPVLQLEPLPVTLNPADYANAVSNANPGGSYATLAAFQQLTNPVPTFSRYYSPSPASTEDVYGNIVNGADVPGGSAFTEEVIAGAQNLFAQYVLANMGGVPGTWHPVYASPADWYDVKQMSRFTPLSIDLTSGSPAVAGFTTLPGTDSDDLAWVMGNPGQTTTQPLHPGTQLQKVSFQALRVDLSRPWLSFEIFQTKGWRLAGQNAGIVSSGVTAQNNGMMPLIATGLIVGLNVSLTANWSAADQAVLRMLPTTVERISLGPFVLFGGLKFPRPVMVNANTVQASVLQVIAWISELVPFSPFTS